MKKNNASNGIFLLNRFKGRSLKIHSHAIPGEYFNCSKFELEKIQPPSACMKAIKERFWRLNLEWRPGVLFSVHALHDGICTYQHFYHNILRHPAKWCWILRDDIVAPICFEDVEAQLTRKLGMVVCLPTTKNQKAILKNIKAIREVVELILDLHENEFRYKKSAT